MERKAWTTREVVYAGLFAALTAVSAQLSIPLFPVPFTLQVLAVLLTGAVLKGRTAALSQGIYLVMGAIGLPVFQGRTGGFHAFLGPTGGYLIGFLLAAWIVGRLMEREGAARGLRGALAMAAGLVAIYVPGVAVLALHLGSLRPALLVGFLHFLPFDLLKAAIAYAIARGLEARGIGASLP